MFYNPAFNNTSNSINGNRAKNRFRPKNDNLMQPITETGDAQDEYELSKAKMSVV